MSAEIKNFYIPHTLYRYRSLDPKKAQRELNAISNATLYCSTFDRLNDPMEGSYRKLTSPTFLKELDEPVFSDSLTNQKQILGICSFSETHNDNMMWAHYADEYRGMCIAYRFSSLRHALPKSVYFTRISYRDNAPTPKRKAARVEEEAYRLLSCKGYKWQFEREWRMLSSQGTISYKNPKVVTDVYLGSRVSEENRSNFIKQLTPHNIRVHTMVLEGYKISFKRA